MTHPSANAKPAPDNNAYVGHRSFDEGRWAERAACAGDDSDAWFSDDPGVKRAAKTVCFTCPVVVDCLNHAIRNKEHYGIWGGFTATERANVKRGLDNPVGHRHDDELDRSSAQTIRLLASGKTAAEVAVIQRISKETVQQRKLRHDARERR